MTEQRPTPTKRTATEAMRLRPATRPGAPAEPDPFAQPAHRDALEQQLAELVAALAHLHAPLELAGGPLCRECLMPHPCRTIRLAHPGAGTETPREDSTQ